MNVNTVLDMYDFYLYMNSNFSYPRCIEVFGESMGEHLWEKWEQSDGNILYFMTRLDITNQEKLIEWHLKKYRS